tara:strand:+ start:2927 stop:3688 length:762 start_codon:yes stop_codon:yes gene_type:complete
MLKKRVIPSLLYRNGEMVKGVQFDNYKNVGFPDSTVEIYTSQDADELMFINISDDKKYKNNFKDIIKQVSKKCEIPLTVGGGINNLETIDEIFNAGADKILINSYIIKDNNFLNSFVKIHGSQALIVGIDYKIENGLHFVYSDYSKIRTNLNIFDYAIYLQDQGAGEILLNCIDRDGKMNGYDIETINRLSQILNIPLIGYGGAGNFEHIFDAFSKTQVSALACSSIFHFGDNNPIRLRSYLRNNSIPMRTLR